MVNQNPSTYTLDLAAPLVTVLAEAHLDKRITYLYGLGDSPLAEDDGAAWRYLSGWDALNSVRQETDAAGQVLAARSFDPYGVPLSGEGGAPFGFTGEYRDSYIKLQWLRARWLDNETGRFVQPDTIRADFEAPVTLNAYLYSYNNPLRWRDPSGQRPLGGDPMGDLWNWVMERLGLDFLKTMPDEQRPLAIQVATFQLQMLAVDNALATTQREWDCLGHYQSSDWVEEYLRAQQEAMGAQTEVDTLMAAGLAAAELRQAAIQPVSPTGPASVDELIQMINQRPGVSAEYAEGDELRFMRLIGAEGRYIRNEDGTTGTIYLDKETATRATAIHEYLHYLFHQKYGYAEPQPGEDAYIEGWLSKYSGILGLEK